MDGPLPILKVAHHGSSTSTTDRLLDAVRPAVAVISVGDGNPFGHPTAEVVARLVDRGGVVLRTDRDGTITVEEQPDGRIAVSTAAGGRWTIAARR